jgi:hypothetical protein
MTALRTSFLLALAACGDVASSPPAAPQWTVDDTTTSGALLGIWGSAPDDIWAVGGGASEAIALHGDGTTWRSVPIDAPGTLFSVYGFGDRDVYAVGEHGLIVHYDGDRWTRVESGTTSSLYGLWGASGDDVWIVGGDIGGAGSALVLRGNARGFVPVTDLPGDIPAALFKVHGFAADNVMLVGDDTVLRWNGATWSRDTVPMQGPLYGVSGRAANDFYAVGGSDEGEILHSNGTEWTEMFDLPIGVGLRGVFAAPDGLTIAVGALGLAFEIDASSTITQAVLPDLGSATFLHGVWGDGEGTIYVAGSDYPHATNGLILRRE